MTSATKKKEPCKHEPDPRSGHCVARFDDGWDIVVECRHCGEFGYAPVLDKDVEWQEEDEDEDED